MRLIISVMVFLGVLNSITFAMYERTGEFGTLMALGNRGRRFVSLIFVENCFAWIVRMYRWSSDWRVVCESHFCDRHSHAAAA